MTFSNDDIRRLREATSRGIMECKKALEEAKGEFNKAKEILKKRGLEIAAKKSGRAANQGRVEAYIHLGAKLGVLIEVNCETDFVAKSEEFIRFTKDVAMHIAACAPKYIKKDDVPADQLRQQADAETFLKESCLLEQPFVKDAGMTIQDYLNSLVAKIGENIFINRFMRYKIGEA